MHVIAVRIYPLFSTSVVAHRLLICCNCSKATREFSQVCTGAVESIRSNTDEGAAGVRPRARYGVPVPARRRPAQRGARQLDDQRVCTAINGTGNVGPSESQATVNVNGIDCVTSASRLL